MNTFRIVSKLEIKNQNLVKGINYEGLRALGPVKLYAKEYFQDGADEIIYQDIVASLYGKNNILQLVKETAKSIFVPMCVGGGVRSLSDINNLLKAGADKVSLNTAAIKNPDFIGKSVKEFGSSTINITIEATKDKYGDIIVMYENGRTKSDLNIFEWIETIQNYEAGEITLNFIHKDGYLKGTDVDFLKKLENKIKIPFLVSGGISTEEEIVNIAKRFKFVSGVVLGSMIHYPKLQKIRGNIKSFINSTSEGNFNFYKKINDNVIFKYTNIKKIKKKLKKNFVNCRL